MDARCERCSRSYPDSTTIEDLRRLRLLLDQLWVRTAMSAQRWQRETDALDPLPLRNEIVAATLHAMRVCANCGDSVCVECWDAERDRCLSCVDPTRRSVTAALGRDPGRVVVLALRSPPRPQAGSPRSEA